MTSPHSLQDNPNPLETEWQRKRLGLNAFCPAVQVMATAVQKWCARLYQNDTDRRCIVLSGPFGMGKTECIKAARRYVGAISCIAYGVKWPHPIVSTFVTWPDFVKDQMKDRCAEQMEDVTTAHAVFLDDIGTEEDPFKSGAPTRILADVLGKLDKRFVFITTNIAPNGWQDRWDRRVEDRLLRNTEVVNLWQPQLMAESYSVWKLQQQFNR